jgi:two-component system phosphate regulon response regulator PhoB
MRWQIALPDLDQGSMRSREAATFAVAGGKAALHSAFAPAGMDLASASNMQGGRNHRTKNAVNASRARPLILLAGETGFISLLKYIVEDNGITCSLSGDLNAVPALAAADLPDLIALDVTQLQGCASAVRQKLYQNRCTRDLPVLFMSATLPHRDQLASGLVDPASVIIKPFPPEAFLERIHDLLRRTSPSPPANVLRFADIIMELEAHRVYRGSRAVSLAPVEYRILQQLLEHPRKVLSRKQILATVQDEADRKLRSVDVHISRIRKALCGHGEPNHIRTVRGIGYSVDAVLGDSATLAIASRSDRADG